jgi:RHS repeat-associated protein
MTDAAGSESWAYDKMGREWGEQRTINSITKTTSYTYNLDGSLATQTYPSGRLITYTVNAASQPTSAEDVANGIPYVSNAFYAPTGAIAIYSAGALSNYTTIYNNRLQPCWSYANTGSSSLPVNTACTGTATAATVLDLKYNFHLGTDNGNIYSVTNDRDTTRSQTFTYDQVNRIVTAQSNTTCGSNCWTQAFTYDQWANLTTAVATGTAPPLNIAVNANNQVSTAGFGFDAAGNETADVTSTYAWNAESEMKTGGGVNYTYDGDGDRVQKSNGKIYWYGAGSEILDETDATGSTTNATFSEYIYFDGKRAARRDYQSNVFYYFADQVGSARGMAEVASGSHTASPCFDADFYPFGGEHDFTNTCAQNYKFMGKERDPETNNDDFGARSYASAYGRFLSADWSSTPSPIPYANLTTPKP